MGSKELDDLYEDFCKISDRMAALARINHAIGDGFAAEAGLGSGIWQTRAWEELAELPGVYMITYGTTTGPGGRRGILTNQSWMCPLSVTFDTPAGQPRALKE